MAIGFSVLRPYLLGLLVLLPIMFLAWRLYPPSLRPNSTFIPELSQLAQTIEGDHVTNLFH